MFIVRGSPKTFAAGAGGLAGIDMLLLRSEKDFRVVRAINMFLLRREKE